MLNRNRRVRRLLVRSIGQVSVSVLATLAATVIYSGLRHGVREIAEPTAPALTSGGKLAARVDGGAVAAFDPPAPHLPILSVFDWTPPSVTASSWPASAPPHPEHPPRTALRRAAPQLAAVQPPLKPSELRLEAPAAPPAPPASAPSHRIALLGAADDLFGRAAGAVGAATDSVASAARGAADFGGTVLGHVMP